jgi:PEGA domain
MDAATAKVMPAEEPLFHDGLGERMLVRDGYGKPLHESFVIRAELSAVPAFEFELNQRLTQLEQFDHPAFLRIRRLESVPGHLPGLSLVSDWAGGSRLSDVLTAMEKSGTRAPVGAVLFVAREILVAVAALHQHSPGIAHGALAPERVVVNGKIRITDYVLGSAIEQLRFPAERYWKELRVAVPASAGALRLDRRADIAQVGMIALALFAGRPLRASEHMGNLGEALSELSLPDPIKTWLLRMLHLDPRRAYVSAVEASQGLEEAIAEADIQPTPLVLSALGIRTQPVGHAVPVRTAPVRTPSPIAFDKPIALRAAAQPDPWENAHDVSSARRVGGRGVSDTADEARSGWFGSRLRMILKIGLLGAALAGAFTAAQFVPAPAMFSKTGTLAVESNPAGAVVLVDGQDTGVTPLTLKLKSGSHDVELRGSGKQRMFKVYISPGANVSQYVELRVPSPRARKTE